MSIDRYANKRMFFLFAKYGQMIRREQRSDLEKIYGKMNAKLKKKIKNLNVSLAVSYPGRHLPY